jgi:hypothetical protein
MEELRANKLALILPSIEAVGASFIGLSHTFAYFNTLEQWLSQLIFFRSHYHVLDCINHCSCPQ